MTSDKNTLTAKQTTGVTSRRLIARTGVVQNGRTHLLDPMHPAHTRTPRKAAMTEDGRIFAQGARPPAVHAEQCRTLFLSHPKHPNTTGKVLEFSDGRTMTPRLARRFYGKATVLRAMRAYFEEEFARLAGLF